MRKRIPNLCLFVLTCTACVTSTNSQSASANAVSIDSDFEKLTASADPNTLQQIATRAAVSNNQKHLRSLAALLADKRFLDRLDPPTGPDPGSYANTRLAPVIQGLAANKSPAAAETLLQLTSAKDFNGHAYRIQLLIHALASINPPNQESLAYWTRCADPESSLLPDIVLALCSNQSDAALALFQSLVLDPKQSAVQKESWFHTIILPRRYDEPLLLSCKKLLESKNLPGETETLILESLFDYRPSSWYAGDDPPKSPELKSASLKSKDLLRSIATNALTRNLTVLQKAPITATLQTLKDK